MPNVLIIAAGIDLVIEYFLFGAFLTPPQFNIKIRFIHIFGLLKILGFFRNAVIYCHHTKKIQYFL